MSDLPTAPLLIFLTLLGLAVGSFLNVVVHRVPLGLSVNSPPSACPACTAPVRPRDNIPVLSWLVLRGRCRDCAAPISARYPAVEAGTAAVYLALGLRFSGESYLPALLAVAGVSLALLLIDLDHHRLPFVLTVPAFALAAALLGVSGILDGWEPLRVALLSTLVWTVLIAALWWGTQGRGMGFGDVLLAPTLGLVTGWLGWGASLVGLLSAFALGAIVGVSLVLAGRLERGAAIPFGPFLILGAALGVAVGEPLWAAYLEASGY
ncbi:MAG: prepilin peptidase [Sporichthyaceae bacterium]